MDQPGKVANPPRGQLNRENNIALSPCAPENLISRGGFSRPVPRQPAHLHTQAESGAYLRDSSRVPRRRPSLEGEPGPTPAEKTLPHSYPETRFRRERTHEVNTGDNVRWSPLPSPIKLLLVITLEYQLKYISCYFEGINSNGNNRVEGTIK